MALQQLNTDEGLLLEGVLIGIEEFLRIYEAQYKQPVKPDNPTVKY